MKGTVRHEVVGIGATGSRLRIAHLSDLHLWWGAGSLREVERCLAHGCPDVLVLTGDYADTPLGQRSALSWIERLSRTYPLFWIAGNHDRWWGGAFLDKLCTLQGACAIDGGDGWAAMRNGRRLRFTSWARYHREARDAPHKGRPVAPTVVLLHDLAEAEPHLLESHPCLLLLAGHLHGGQIVLWRDRHGRPQPSSLLYRWVPERTLVGGVPMIVSRGWGDTLPLRWRAPREVVVVDLLVS